MASSFLLVLLYNVTELTQQELELQSDLEKQVKRLISYIKLVESFLTDASERQQTEDAVKEWLNQLRDVAYDANDVLDSFAYEAQRRQLIRFATARNSLSLLSPRRAIFRRETATIVEDVNQALDDIAIQRNALGLVVRDRTSMHGGEEASGLLQSTSLNSSTFHPLGREEDKQRVIDLLVAAGGENSGTVSVVPVVGMGGLGKTTLAQLVYNDQTIERHFGLRLWVHVSRNFDVNKITRSVIEDIDCTACDSPTAPISSFNLEVMQKQLRKRLSGRRYLLVLDDVWNTRPLEWERLMAPLLYGAMGSKILVTTRSEEVASLMIGVGAAQQQLYRLTGLSDDDCWSLFCQRAMGGKPYLGPDFDNLGSEIVNRCKGLPSAVEAIGFRLRRENDLSRWGSILRDEMWEFSGEDSDITCSTRISYEHLPGSLKPCFVYCSLIPKGFVFDKELLVQLWMSQNFIREERMEEVGRKHFDSLVKRSFFQFSHFDYRSNTSKYTMHSVIHDFVRNESGEECCILDTNSLQQFTATEKTRHACLVYGISTPTSSRQSSMSSSSSSPGLGSPRMGSRKLSSLRPGTGNMFEIVYGSKGLYTLIVIGVYGLQVPDDLAKKLKCLRALDLSNSGISYLPESIGELKHLRYLQLRGTNIRRLPESFGCLYNLQTLGLANCYGLEELPKETHFLHKLRHLDLRLEDDTLAHSLRSMPRDIGELTALRTLSRFVVSQEKKCPLSELENLNSLQGELHISNLDLVLWPQEAKCANLFSKEQLEQLVLQWGYCSNMMSFEVLELLHPHTSLKGLKIIGYDGANFPSWIGKMSFVNLTTVTLSGCKGCEILPPLGQLPLLKALYIRQMDSVVLVDCKLCGHARLKFPSLEKLHFERMPRLQAWASSDEGCELPALRELVFRDCGDLRQLTHKHPHLVKLVIENSPWLLGLPTIPSLQQLDVKASSEMVWESVPRLTSLSSLTMSQLMVRTVPLGKPGPATLRRMEISYWSELEFFPDSWIPVGLKSLAIKHCPKLRCLPRELVNVVGLEDLEIENCGQLQNLPEWLPRGLQFLSIDNCPVLRRNCLDQEWYKIAHLSYVWIDKQPVISGKAQSKKA